MKKALWAVIAVVFSLASVSAEDQSYEVRRGDNLWSLADRFFQTPHKWLDIWKLNPDVNDPHWIYPGLKLKLPLSLRPKEPVQEPVSGQTQKASDAQPQPVTSTPVASPAPAPLTVKELFIYEEKAREVAVREEVKPVAQPVVRYVVEIPEINRLAWFSETPIVPVSTVVSPYDGRKMGQSMSQFFIDGGELKGLKKGEVLHIMRLFREIADDRSGKITGRLYTRIGILKVTELYPQMAVGTVVKGYTEIESGDFLVALKEKDNPEVVVKKSRTFLEGKIIDVQEGKYFVSDRNFVFIDKGRVDGLEKGDVLNIEKQVSDISEKYLSIGKMVVVKTWDTVSAAYIHEIRDVISPGFRFTTYFTGFERN